MVDLASDEWDDEALIGRARDVRARMWQLERRARAMLNRPREITLAEDALPPFEHWAAEVRAWRDGWARVAAYPLRGQPGDGWFLGEPARIIAELCTPRFAARIMLVFSEMADYLERLAPITGCPEQATWATDCRGWVQLWGHVAALQATGVTGRIDNTADLLASPVWLTTMVRVAPGEVAAMVVKKTAGMAEFFMGESRRLIGVKAS